MFSKSESNSTSLSNVFNASNRLHFKPTDLAGNAISGRNWRKHAPAAIILALGQHNPIVIDCLNPNPDPDSPAANREAVHVSEAIHIPVLRKISSKAVSVKDKVGAGGKGDQAPAKGGAGGKGKQQSAGKGGASSKDSTGGDDDDVVDVDSSDDDESYNEMRRQEIQDKKLIADAKAFNEASHGGHQGLPTSRTVVRTWYARHLLCRLPGREGSL